MNKDLSIFFLVIIILFFYFFAPLLYFVNENNNILNIVLLLIPIVNLSFNSGTNNYWIAMVINLIIILSFYFWILISLAKTKKINKQLNHFKGKINKKLSSFELNIENFEILTGDIIGIMGSNGSGKTTFINTLIDSFPKKREVNNLRLENYSYLKQTNNLGNLKLNNIVELISKLTKSKVDIEKLYLEYDLLTLKDHYFSKLSPGQQQRFKLLLLDLYDTQVLILDEVFNFVDINWKDKIIKKLNRFKDDNKTMLIIDHDFDNLKLVCNKLIILKEGKIIYKEKIKNIENKNQIEKFIR